MHTNINMLEAMTLVTWECVSQETLVNGFKKASVISASQVRNQSDDDDPFKLLDAQLEDFQDKRESTFAAFTDDEYVDVDEDVLTSEAHAIEIIPRVT